jgi:hypothetical protein
MSKLEGAGTPDTSPSRSTVEALPPINAAGDYDGGDEDKSPKSTVLGASINFVNWCVQTRYYYF